MKEMGIDSLVFLRGKTSDVWSCSGCSRQHDNIFRQGVDFGLQAKNPPPPSPSHPKCPVGLSKASTTYPQLKVKDKNWRIVITLSNLAGYHLTQFDD